MQEDMSALINIVRELLEMFPPGQQSRADQLRGNIVALERKYEAGLAAWDLNPPPPVSVPVGP